MVVVRIMIISLFRLKLDDYGFVVFMVVVRGMLK